MTKAHADPWERASADRRSFEIAAYGVELVASKESREAVERLWVFLEGAAYSGTPWRFDSPDHHDYPTAALNPADIEPKAIEEVGPFVRRAARELWRRDAPEA